jgi:hypothetical protein
MATEEIGSEPLSATAEAADLAAIRQVQAAYNIAGDRLRLAELAATFTEDGVLETATDRMVGRAAIAEGLDPGRKPAPANGVRRPTLVRHNLTTSSVALTGAASAEARSYFIVFTDIGPDHMGVYVDKLAKTGDGWRLAHRRVFIDWLSPESLFPELAGPYRARVAARGGA